MSGNLIRINCGCGRQAISKGRNSKGQRIYGSICSTCREIARSYKLEYCQNCGTFPNSKRDLDVDHIDGNKHNNNPENLQTLCKPCHNQKTVKNGDWRHYKYVQAM